MKIISIVTGTRAEYGLLKPLILELLKCEDIQLKVVVTGSHLSLEFGYTYEEIERDGIVIDEKIEILLNSDSNVGVLKAMGLCIIGFAEYFNRIKPDMLIVLGDRFEMFSVAISAMNLKIPIAHIHGGETTQGALDEAIRHSITKMSSLHFTSCEIYRNRVIQLGENPKTVHNVGSLSVEVIRNLKFLSKEELDQKLGISLKKIYFMVVFHPATLERNSGLKQLENLMESIDCFEGYDFIMILGNADADGLKFNCKIKKFGLSRNNVHIYRSLEHIVYLSALKYSNAIIGNSSSAIFEADALNIFTINIGNRQKGRVQGKKVINISGSRVEVLEAIDKVIENEVDINECDNKIFGDGFTTLKIIKIIQKYFSEEGKSLEKKFYDIL